MPRFIRHADVHLSLTPEPRLGALNSGNSILTLPPLSPSSCGDWIHRENSFVGENL